MTRRDVLVAPVDEKIAIEACKQATPLCFDDTLTWQATYGEWQALDSRPSEPLLVRIKVESVAEGTRVVIVLEGDLIRVFLRMRKYKKAIALRATELSQRVVVDASSLRRGSLRVFLSYRRDDSRDISGRVADQLEMALGKECVFQDVGAIDPGVDFVDKSLATVRASDVLLAVIGPEWSSVGSGKDKRSRLHDDADLLRRELEEGIEQKLRIIPVLVNGARMPSERSLPSSLSPLARLNALELRSDHFRVDMDHLMRVLAGIEKR